MAAGEVNCGAAAGLDMAVASVPDCMLELSRDWDWGWRIPAMAAALAELANAGAESAAGTRDLG